MQLILIIVGAFLGYTLGEIDFEILGLVAGAAIGYLFATVISLQKRVHELTQRTPDRRMQPIPGEPPVAPPRPEVAEPEVPATAKSAVIQPSQPDPPKIGLPPISPTPISPPPPGTIDRLIALSKEWLTTGNVPVKLGVIVSFFGVAFLLKYAVDNQILVIPLWLRYLFVAAFASVLLGVGWRLRDKTRIYALSLQGGGVGILYLTIFAAFRLHPLLPPTFAFTLLVALTVFAGVLAVLQDAKALSILAVVGGFAAPVLIPTGSGHHVLQFSYYLVINCAVLGIAWYKAWRGLNLIGFIFTFGIGALWGYEFYRPELFASTEPFLVAYFLFYQAVAILFSLRQAPNLRGLIDATLIFGTPVIAFALQSQLVEGMEYGLAISAITLALFYTGVATWLYQTRGQQFRLLIESYVALGVAFATIAIPLALDDRWTAVAWALEGAALVWVGVRQHGILAKLSGVALLGASGLAFMEYGWKSHIGVPLLNGNFLGGMLIALSSIFAARQLAADKRPSRLQAVLSAPLLLWGVGWWATSGSLEIFDRIGGNSELHAFTAFIAGSVALLAWTGRHFDWAAARRITLVYLPLLPVVAVAYLWDQKHIFAGIGTMSWIAALSAHFGLLWAYDNGRGRVEGIWHFAGALFIAGLLWTEVHWRMGQASFSDIWAVSAALLVSLAVTSVILFGRERLAWPLQRYWGAYLLAAVALVALHLLGMMAAGIDQSGDPSPLRYVPILNPFDVLTILTLVVALKLVATARSTTSWLDGRRGRLAMAAWGISAFVLSTIAVVRGVHHFSDIVWRQNALMDAVQVQSALSIYWAILGFSGMIWGARNNRRWVWIGGTALMVLVVAKLFVIDLGNTGTVARIVSFLGVGALLLVVGYFAPAPPRQTAGEN